MINRRDLLYRTASVAAGSSLFASRLAALVEAEDETSALSATPSADGFRRLEIEAAELAPLARFYAKTIGWPVEQSGGALTVRAGGTLVRFTKAAAGTAPYYHVAWSIPSNQFGAAKAWLGRRTPLLRHADGRDEFHFRTVNRRGVYFADPAGNILELIARDQLRDERPGPFGVEHILSVNHAGLVVRDMAKTIASLRDGLGLEVRYEPQPTFATLGDENRHLVLVPEGRKWLPEGKLAAKIFPLRAVLGGREQRKLTLSEFDVQLAIESDAV